jgi:hypothetical protein
MPSPTFNGNKLFSSIDSNGSTVDEGCLWVPDYQQITQRIHFEGEIGDYTLYHGYADMPWTFRGMLSATNGGDFGTLLSAIQTAIDANTSDSDTYHALTDSFGNSYTLAQIRHLHVEPPHQTADGGFCAQVQVTGVIQGNDKYGTSSGSSGS